MTNTSFDKSRYISTGAKSWAQTVYYGNTFDPTNANTGWWDGKDLTIDVIKTELDNTILNLGRELDAVALAALEEVTVYTDPEGGSFGAYVGIHANTHFGDIWINANTTTQLANGTLSVDAIHRWQNAVGGYVNTG